MRWPLLTARIEHEDDIVAVRQRVRVIGAPLGFGVQDLTRIATAVSEIARNAYSYAQGGKIEYGLDEGVDRQSLVIRISDNGPGIADLDAILEGRYRSTTGLGIGITGTRRLMDRFEIESAPGQGTAVTFGKQLPPGSERFTGPKLAALAETVARARAEDPNATLREHNRELMRSLSELAEREEEAQRLNAELAETNRGVVALYAELEVQAGLLRESRSNLESQVEARTRELAAANARLRTEAVERERVEDALRQSQKLEAVGQLTGGVAHDFNNLLTIIRSSADFLQRPGLPEERRSRYVNAISDTVSRASKLTGQLLAFARRQTLHPEVFEVGAALRSVVEMLDTLTGARVAIDVTMPDEPCYVRADLSQFETALVNMVVNARDAMGGGGRLALALRQEDVIPTIRGHAAAPGRFAAVALGDTGTGIAPDHLGRIFEPFFTTKEVGKGTGLGLSQVFGFAKQSGGDVAVESTVGEGTTFTIYLPQVEDGVGTGQQARDDVEAPTSGLGQRILVVEDNVEVGRFCIQILQDLGYEPTWAVNAEEALEMLSAEGRSFDLVFSDVVMPGIGGLELAKRLRIQRPDLPVVLTSGYSHVLAQEGTQGLELLHKPYSADQLARTLAKIASAKPQD